MHFVIRLNEPPTLQMYSVHGVSGFSCSVKSFIIFTGFGKFILFTRGYVVTSLYVNDGIFLVESPVIFHVILFVETPKPKVTYQPLLLRPPIVSVREILFAVKDCTVSGLLGFLNHPVKIA